MKAIYKMSMKKIIPVLMLMGAIASNHQSFGQLNPFGASYFQNQFLINPAMAGIDKNLKINLGYRREWNAIPDGPTNQYLTGEYGMSNKMNIGLNVNNDKAGVLRSTSVMAAYSYYVPLNEKDRKLHLGLSAGVVNRSLDNKTLNGDVDDMSLANAKGTHFDGGLGLAYSDSRLTVQGAFPNMVTYFGKNEKDVVTRTTFFAAASYKIPLNKENTVKLEPKVAYRGVKGFDNIIDVGANVSFSDYLNFFGMYHTSKNVTLGAGLTVKSKLTLMAIYTTSPPTLNDYTSGNFEIGIGLSLWNKK